MANLEGETVSNTPNRRVPARTYAEWSAAAKSCDRVSGADAWKADEVDGSFDAADIRRRQDSLRQSVESRDGEGLLNILSEGIHGNMGGMGNPELYARSKYGTKDLIPQYVAAIIEALDVVARSPENEVAFGEKLDFFQRASLCYGRSALMLSGGGGGYISITVWSMRCSVRGFCPMCCQDPAPVVGFARSSVRAPTSSSQGISTPNAIIW
ncbi:DUF3336 domain-containing protein [Novosphingobium sp. Gsoil 351]|uniref:DUF3336 domain-containing protein n=1 Tax=Novosphingobium sp. Gsoil 351 TaxID=2675225 RepID=UPI0012B4EE14|nr:DUF3336 domain-containing protein [Novosphingobium sp. Gsoil 351]QGN54221.1 DUF3336 domain-containing protein [Novosphingobium sp. Gsoil 351]